MINDPVTAISLLISVVLLIHEVVRSCPSSHSSALSSEHQESGPNFFE